MLADVYPDGRSMLVTDGILRARFRNSFAKEELLEPSQTYKLDVDLWSTSLVFNKGHRIRCSCPSSNDPRFDPNPNTGHPFRADKETRVATNTVHLSAEHASYILLPIFAATGSKATAGLNHGKPALKKRPRPAIDRFEQAAWFRQIGRHRAPRIPSKDPRKAVRRSCPKWCFSLRFPPDRRCPIPPAGTRSQKPFQTPSFSLLQIVRIRSSARKPTWDGAPSRDGHSWPAFCVIAGVRRRRPLIPSAGCTDPARHKPLRRPIKRTRSSRPTRLRPTAIRRARRTTRPSRPTPIPLASRATTASKRPRSIPSCES